MNSNYLFEAQNGNESVESINLAGNIEVGVN